VAHRFSRSVLAVALAATALQPVLAAAAPVQDSAQAGDIVVNMRGVEIADVADQISRLTGRTLILDPAVRGTVTVTSATPLSAAGVWDLFQSVLRANGFAAVQSGRAWRIVPQANAVRDGGVRRSGSGQELVTRMIRLSNVPAAEAARIARPIIASFGSVEPLASPNAIVVTDYADNVRRVEALMRQLDGGGGQTYATIPLRNGSAPDVAAAIGQVLGEGEAGGARVAADARSNTVIVRGTPASVAEARRIAVSLDAPGGATPITRVFRLNFADAESVTDVLRGVLGQEGEATNPVARSLQSRGTRGGVGGIARNPTAQLAGIVGQEGAQAAAALGGGSAAGNSISTVGQSERDAPAQGFSTPDLTVQPAPDINAIVVRGTPTAVANMETIVADLDVRRPQVILEAAIAEITGDEAEQLAIQIGSAGAVLSQVEGVATSFQGSNNIGLGSILTALGVPAAALIGDGLTGNVAFGNDFSILVQALGTSQRANLLSTPSVTVVDNKIGEFVVAQEVPFITGSILTQGNNVAPFTSIERKDVGITLRVLPRINAGDTIRLEISQEASSIAPIQLQQATDLITNRRAINTTVLADNGRTIVLGGLISDDYTRQRSQVPILGDVPILGELFKSRREMRQKRTLFIFLRPTILRDGDAAASETDDRYRRLRGEEAQLGERRSLLLRPPAPRLTVEIDGIY
jgi:general secretion pathway protein D